ncbi:glycosyltransferase [Celeribacter persicus]|uniref:GT2 family glycosyltransferase n=1 Tax=Celeribacter persicus TaxID=1651082 RepID=A0A2T5HM88_9RHOB|nr:glycosyltransferase [Celeribacter persicus]PTQ72695.1 GT2 family glycosyltransferase [Celeribacter persicus]
MNFTSEVIVATYNKPEYLRLCLKSIAEQSLRPTSICLADDGSDARIEPVIEAFRATYPDLPLRRSWHEDRGFRKSVALNRAIAGSECDYLVFLDDDVILHPKALRRHFSCAMRGRYLTGSLIRLDAELTQRLLQAQSYDWSEGHLAGWTPKGRSQWLKSMPFPPAVMALLDRLSPVSPNFQGACASVWREDVLRVNGFEGNMSYGGLDKEIGVRLRNAGIRGRHVRYTAPAYHLDHGRSYADQQVKQANRDYILTLRKSGETQARNGIAQLAEI